MAHSPRGFDLPPSTAALICASVLSGGPILQVLRDEDGQWQFLCDLDHSNEGFCPPQRACLSEVLERDRTLLEVSDLCLNWSAWRSYPGGEWVRHDEYQDGIREHIEEFGWHVSFIQRDEEGPGFAYSIGLYHTFRKPEIIVFGLPLNVAHSVISRGGDVYKGGRPIPIRTPLQGFLEGTPVLFREVERLRYPEYFGYGLWYYSGPAFPALQCFWPDKSGRFPWEPGFRKDWLKLQPDLG